MAVVELVEMVENNQVLVEMEQLHLEEKSMFHLEDQMVEMVEKVEVLYLLLIQV